MEKGTDYYNQPDPGRQNNQTVSQDTADTYGQSDGQYGQNTYGQQEGQPFGQGAYNPPGGQPYGQNAYNQQGQPYNQNTYNQQGQPYNQNTYGQNMNYNSGMGYGTWQKPVGKDGRPLENRYGMKLVFSILEIVSCNFITLVMGIIGCVYTNKANKAYMDGRWEDFRSYAKSSAICLWTGLGTFVAGIFLLILLWTAGGLGEAFMEGFWEGYYSTYSSYTYSSNTAGESVYVDDTYIGIPLTYREIEAAGFSLSTYDNYETLDGGEFGLYKLQNREEDTVCWGWFYNRNSWEEDITECMIIGIDVDYNCENYESFKTSEGLGFFDSMEDYITVYGEPDRRKEEIDSETLYWYLDNGSDKIWRVIEVTFEGDLVYDIDIDYR